MLFSDLQAGMISSEDIIIDAKSGVSGAGRAGKVQFLYSEIAEGINSYGVGGHRHMPEIEQELTLAAGVDVTISFTPHLMCMTRGMQSTMYALCSACLHTHSMYSRRICTNRA
jgi:N-acetyl-gamma-glutamyl-phosphate reductase